MMNLRPPWNGSSDNRTPSVRCGRTPASNWASRRKTAKFGVGRSIWRSGKAGCAGAARTIDGMPMSSEAVPAPRTNCRRVVMISLTTPIAIVGCEYGGSKFPSGHQRGQGADPAAGRGTLGRILFLQIAEHEVDHRAPSLLDVGRRHQVAPEDDPEGVLVREAHDAERADRDIEVDRLDVETELSVALAALEDARDDVGQRRLEHVELLRFSQVARLVEVLHREERDEVR